MSSGIKYALFGGLIALVVHGLNFQAESSEPPLLYILDILFWVVAAYVVGHMKDGWTKRAMELETANEELQKEMEVRRKVEQDLRESEERFRDLFDNTRDLIQIISPDGRVLYANRAWRENLGFSEDDEVCDHPVFELIHPDYHNHCIDRFQRLLSGEDVDKIVTEFVAKDGRRILLEGVCSCKFEEGKPVSIRGIFRDITERKRMEEELHKAQKLEAIGILAGGIAHDFNNLLSGLLAVITLVKANLPQDSNQIEILEEARQTCLQGKELTSKFLTFSEGGYPLKKCIDIASVLEKWVQVALRGSVHECEFSIASECEVLIDENQIQQVINNLVINAREAMPDGGKIQMATKKCQIKDNEGFDLQPGEYLQISITDHGVGIPKENMAKIFDPYFTTKRMASKRGTGFGLAICHSILKKHDGTITVDSDNAAGTTFHVFLPVCNC